MGKLLYYLSGEFVLRWMPNGGKAVFIRTVFVSFLIYTVTIALKSATDPCSVLQFSWYELRSEINETISWAGAVLGGVYAALYARFASQWTYLADLYNQQMALYSSNCDATINEANYVRWQAAFIEDAVCMHLATKQGFSNAIRHMLAQSNIRQELIDDEGFGLDKLTQLERSLDKSFNAGKGKGL